MVKLSEFQYFCKNAELFTIDFGTSWYIGKVILGHRTFSKIVRDLHFEGKNWAFQCFAVAPEQIDRTINFVIYMCTLTNDLR